MLENIITAYLIWNTAVFAVYGLDKWKAKAGAYRIPEKTLLTLAALFGGIGAITGMRVFRHKTKTRKFTVLVPILAILNIVMLFFAVDRLGI